MPENKPRYVASTRISSLRRIPARVTVCYAPFLERLAAFIPSLYPNFKPRGGRFEALNDWCAGRYPTPTAAD